MVDHVGHVETRRAQDGHRMMRLWFGGFMTHEIAFAEMIPDRLIQRSDRGGETARVRDHKQRVLQRVRVVTDAGPKLARAGGIHGAGAAARVLDAYRMVTQQPLPDVVWIPSFAQCLVPDFT